MKKRSLTVWGLVLQAIFLFSFVWLPGHASAKTTFNQYSITLDIWHDTPVGPLAPGDILSYQAGSFKIQQVNMPPAVKIQALGRKDGDSFIVPDVTFSKGGQVFTPRDILRVSPDGELGMFASAESLLLEPPSKISAIAFMDDDLVVVLDTVVQISNQVFTPRDLIRYSAGVPHAFFIGQDFDIPQSARIVSVDVTGSGQLLLSFSSTISLNGQVIRASDIVSVSLQNDSTITLAAKRELMLGSCAECRLGGFSATINEDVIFRTRFIDFWR
ncbi:hypothetical protein [Wenzhouxiangella limi]|uniref:Uncharacterized protein n=1 Tax=Wenzhouxiangella limi TaxID=2707351 RepID=A0A845URD7_9GAMM|nr:hypothetical protein [Wenzhouxiangella limi]NDY94403.1 hypothetical protein [Wenzhouxiangella limi]